MQYEHSNVDFPHRGFEMEIAALGRCTNINVGCTLSARDFVWIHVGNSFCAGELSLGTRSCQTVDYMYKTHLYTLR